VRDAAEAAGRGRCPTVGPLTLFDHGLDEARHHGLVLLAAPEGGELGEALAERPFGLALLCPPPGGFTAEEQARAAARGVRAVRPPLGSRDPVRSTMGLLEAVFEALEPAPGAAL
jgi:hypothetical protein